MGCEKSNIASEGRDEHDVCSTQGQHTQIILAVVCKDGRTWLTPFYSSVLVAMADNLAEIQNHTFNQPNCSTRFLQKHNYWQRFKASTRKPRDQYPLFSCPSTHRARGVSKELVTSF